MAASVECVFSGDQLHLVEALVRSSKFFASDQSPQILFISERGLAVGGNRTRVAHEIIPLGDVIGVSVVGRWVWRSVELVFEKEGVERVMYLTPFSGDPGRPEYDERAVAGLCEKITGMLSQVGVRL